MKKRRTETTPKYVSLYPKQPLPEEFLSRAAVYVQRRKQLDENWKDYIAAHPGILLGHFERGENDVIHGSFASQNFHRFKSICTDYRVFVQQNESIYFNKMLNDLCIYYPEERTFRFAKYNKAAMASTTSDLWLNIHDLSQNDVLDYVFNVELFHSSSKDKGKRRKVEASTTPSARQAMVVMAIRRRLAPIRVVAFAIERVSEQDGELRVFEHTIRDGT